MCPGCWEVKEARAFIEPLKLKPSCFRKCWSVMGHITRAWCTFNDISGHGDNTLHSDEILWSCWVEDCPHAPPSVSLTLLLPHRCFHVSKPLNHNLCIFFFFFSCCAWEFCTTQEQAYWVAWFALLPGVSSCLPCVQGLHAFPCAAAKLLCCKPCQDHLCCWETLVAVAAMSVACLPVSECCNEQG